MACRKSTNRRARVRSPFQIQRCIPNTHTNGYRIQRKLLNNEYALMKDRNKGQILPATVTWKGFQKSYLSKNVEHRAYANFNTKKPTEHTAPDIPSH